LGQIILGAQSLLKYYDPVVGFLFLRYIL